MNTVELCLEHKLNIKYCTCSMINFGKQCNPYLIGHNLEICNEELSSII